jgi:hypothetical protein
MNMHIIRMKYIYNTCALSKHIGNTHIYLYAFDSAQNYFKYFYHRPVNVYLRFKIAG